MRQTITSEWFNKPSIKRVLAFIFASMFLCISAFAQERTLTGTVNDASGLGLPGVNVSIKGTTTGVVTDLDGKFTIKVPGANSVILITYVGYKTQEITVGEQTSINIILVEDIKQMDEVVVVGYGVQKKKLVTGATVQVKNEDLVKSHVTRLESALQGITPGVSIVKQNGQPGADFNISIRGLSSVNGNEPLVLIDGVVGSLNTLNPEDVESVDVLKDAASAAIYGSRAANGVILVTTKKGKAGEITVSYEATYGISNATKKIDVLNAKEYAEIMNEQRFNSDPKKKPWFTQEYIDTVGNGTDWQKEAYKKNAVSQSHYVGINGGNEASSFSVSLSYKKEEGIFNIENKSNYERMGFRINSDHKVKKYLTIGENLTYSHRKTRSLGNGNQYNNFYHDLLGASPLIIAHDTSSYDGFGRSKFQDQQFNPLTTIHYYNNEEKKYDDIIGSIYAELKIADGLKFKSDFGGKLNFNYNTNFSDTFHINKYTFNLKPNYTQNMSRDFSYILDNVLTYEKNIGENNFLFMIGSSVEDNYYYNMYTQAYGKLYNQVPAISNVTKVDSAVISGDFGKGDGRFSYFGRFSYNYSEKYLLTTTFRRDVSSRFAPNKRVGYFPSISVGWTISKEEFLSNVAWLNHFKLRASWGQNGKEPYARYRYLSTVNGDNRFYYFGNERRVGISPNIIANSYLKWESAEQINIGFDSRFLKCLSFTFDYYNKTQKDWIVQKTVPGVSGIEGISADNPYINGGNVINKGVEFDLAYNKSFGDLNIEIRGNLAYNKNKVTNVPDSIIHGSASVLYNGSEEFYRVEEGYPIGYFWGYETDGIFQDSISIANYNYTNPTTGKVSKIQSLADPGDVKFVDRNKDGKISADDKTMIGDPNPHFIFGLNFSASFKGFDASIVLSGQAGNQVVKSYRAQERFFFNYTSDEINGRWTGPGTSNHFPRVVENDDNNNWRRFSDLYVYDADFLRIKSINVGYDFKRLFKDMPISQFKVYLSATNLYTFTSYNGIDPEIGYGSYYDASGSLRDGYASGIDLGNYPPSRTYMIGVSIKF